MHHFSIIFQKEKMILHFCESAYFTRRGRRASTKVDKVKEKGREKYREGGGEGERRKPPRGSLPQKPDTKLIPRGPTKPLPRWPTKSDTKPFTKVFGYLLHLKTFVKVLCHFSLAISEVVSLALSETFFGRLPRKGFGLMRARARVRVCV